MNTTDSLGIPDRGSAKGSDPQTAVDAAAMVRPGSQRRALLEIHRQAPMGLTDEEAARAAGISLGSEYATRCSELVRYGLLEDTNQTRAGESGMQRMVRRITDLGRSALGFPRMDVSPVREEARCSCGEGPVGHSTSHESSDKPGIVRMVREGKTDQYVNIGLARSQAQQSRSVQEREDESARQRATPRVVLRARDLGIGAVLCPRCKGTGGNLLEACYRCSGSGLT